MTMPPTPRRIAWSEETDATKMRLILGDLDKLDIAFSEFRAEIAEEFVESHKENRETRSMVRRKLNVIMTIAAGALVALSGNLIVLLLTR